MMLQETDPALPADMKLTDDTHEHEDVPNVDLETFNALVAEVQKLETAISKSL